MALPQNFERLFNRCMTNLINRASRGMTALHQLGQKTRATSNFHTWLKVLRWVLPLALLLIVIAYETVVAPWFHHGFGEKYHYLSEILFYGTIGPLLAFVLLDFLDRWLEEKETNDVQSRILAEVKAYAGMSHKLNDEALQTLFAVSMLLSSLESPIQKQDPEAAALLKKTENTLEIAINEIREHLENHPLAESGLGDNNSKSFGH
jgi:signal transduction histidine kinase